MWIYCVASADGGAFKLLRYQLPMVVHTPFNERDPIPLTRFAEQCLWGGPLMGLCVCVCEARELEALTIM